MAGGLVAAGIAIYLPSTAQAASLGAAYTKTSDWTGGYTAQYLVTNDTDQTLSGWKLEFDLPEGARLDSLWNGQHTASGQHVSVTPEEWTTKILAGKSVSIGFVVVDDDQAGDPTHCLINGAKCSVDEDPAPEPSGRPTESATPTATPTETPTDEPTQPPGEGTTAGAGFAPYVDTSLYPAYDMLGAAKESGVKNYNLAFIVSGGGCTPKWGGMTDLGSDAVAAQLGQLREAGGDVRVSFGGASGSELGLACSSASELAAAYGKAVDTYNLTKVDFDIEGSALPDTAANTRRAQAIAQLQKDAKAQGKELDVSFTLPVMPTGLTQPGVDLLVNAKDNGVDIAAVNVMAMDYGSAFSDDMGQYAIDAATATQAQVKGVLGLSDEAAWQAVAVTPMIGVNDVAAEVFTVDDAKQLVEFASAKHLGWLSMWSATRDKPCSGGPQDYASPICSSVDQQPFDFSKAFAAYAG